MNIPTAQEARERLEKRNNEQVAVQLRCIAEDIEGAISAGKTSITGDDRLFPATVSLLKELGYRLEEETDRRDDTSIWTVSW